MLFFCGFAIILFPNVVFFKSVERANEMEKNSIKKQQYGKIGDENIDIFTLENSNGITAKITNYGGILVSLQTPDRDGVSEEVTLGFDSLEDYLRDHPYFGALVGRFANRIANGKFILDGTEYTLAKNNDENHLHGGLKGFDKVVWNAEPMQDADKVGLKLTYLSADCEEGYPGNLDCEVIYSLTEDDELIIEYKAATDKPTIVNLTNHTYFNLTGDYKRDILSHHLMLNADSYTPSDETLIPTGEIKLVKDSSMDFTTPAVIGSRIEQVPGGYDHNYVINSQPGEMRLTAKVYEPASGRCMDVYTDQPGVQFYTGNFLDGSLTGKNGVKFDKHFGLCLETQHFPDSPNKPEFPSVILRPGETYKHKTLHKFYTK